jgi:ribosomal protein S5
MLTLAGIKNVTAKLRSGSKNKLNNARVAYAALYQLRAKAALPKIAQVIAEAAVSEKDLLASAGVTEVEVVDAK